MFDLLDVSNIFFQVWDYRVSYLEFFGTVLYFASVVLIAQKNMLTWPVGIVSVVLFMLLFYQVQLYSDSLEQIYFLGASVVGWLLWSRGKGNEPRIPSSFSSKKTLLVVASLTAAMGFALGAAMSQIHTLLPQLFELPASFPYLDALTTVMSFVAMALLVLRRSETWVYWIIVDLLAIYLYFTKGLIFLGLQYIALLVIASYGLYSWVRSQRSPQSPS